jgi:DNA-3-methyladenine glycosylase I
MADLPASTPESVALSRELRRRGFRFVGPTTVYAAMQSLGVSDDHLADCHVRTVVEEERAALPRP